LLWPIDLLTTHFPLPESQWPLWLPILSFSPLFLFNLFYSSNPGARISFIRTDDHLIKTAYVVYILQFFYINMPLFLSLSLSLSLCLCLSVYLSIYPSPFLSFTLSLSLSLLSFFLNCYYWERHFFFPFWIFSSIKIDQMIEEKKAKIEILFIITFFYFLELVWEKRPFFGIFRLTLKSQEWSNYRLLRFRLKFIQYGSLCVYAWNATIGEYRWIILIVLHVVQPNCPSTDWLRGKLKRALEHSIISVPYF